MLILIFVTLSPDIGGGVDPWVKRIPPSYGWEVIDSIPHPGEMTRVGIFSDGEVIWSLENIPEGPFKVYEIEKLNGSVIREFSFIKPAYALDIVRIGPNLWISSFYPQPERIIVIDTLGNLIKEIYPDIGGRIRGLDWDGDSLIIYSENVNPDSVVIHLMDTLGNVKSNYYGFGIYWSFSLTLSRFEENTFYLCDQKDYSICKVILNQSDSSYFIIETNTHPGPGTDLPEGVSWADDSLGGYLWTNSSSSAWIWKIKVAEPGVGIDREATLSRLRITPNPANREVIVSSIQPSDRILLTIYDVTGRILRRSSGRLPIRIGLDRIPPGVHLLELKTSRYRRVFRFIVFH